MPSFVSNFDWFLLWLCLGRDHEQDIWERCGTCSLMDGVGYLDSGSSDLVVIGKDSLMPRENSKEETKYAEDNHCRSRYS